MKGRPLHERMKALSYLLMAPLYAGGGIFLITSSSLFNSILPDGSWQRIAVGVIFISYGIFRLVRGVKMWLQGENSDNRNR
jgi:hypothetical protein